MALAALDSLVANGPAWHDKFPGLTFGDVNPAVGPDDFPAKETVADYFVAFANKIQAPVRVASRCCRRTQARPARLPRRDNGWDFRGRQHRGGDRRLPTPVVPAMVPPETGIAQMHSTAYRNPAQLPEGAVLIVGSGSSGTQIAEELLDAGRRVYLSVGPHDRPPRAYRGRDYCWWLGVLGKWDAVVREAGKEHVTIAVSGAKGGHTIDFRELALKGMILVAVRSATRAAPCTLRTISRRTSMRAMRT